MSWQVIFCSIQYLNEGEQQYNTKERGGDMSINVTEDSIKSVSGILSNNEEYMYKLNSSIQQAKDGKVISKSMEELEKLASE